MPLVHVNVPYPMLLQRIDACIENRIAPEVFFSGEDLDTCCERDVRRLSEKLQHHGLEISFHGPFMDLSPGGVDRRVKEVTRDRFLRVIDLAQFFKPKTIVFHPGYDPWKFDGNTAIWLASSLETWEPLVERAEARGLTLAIENVFEETPETLKLLLEKIDSPRFRFCFDTGHHNVFSRLPLEAWLESLGKYLYEVHLHDNHGTTDEHLPVGEGTFDFDRFFGLLSKMNLAPVLTLEPHEEEHLRRTLENVKKYLAPD
jgi:sugar phosphate isomerase/epimerase